MTIDADHLRALKLAHEVLEELGVKRRLVGALASQCLLGISHRTTLDVDIAIFVSSWDQYREVRDALLSRGFAPGKESHRLLLDRSHIDLLPYSAALLRGTRLVWPDGQTMDMTGFEHVFEGEEMADVGDGLRWPVVSLPVFVILKLACFGDRRKWKDLADVLFCLEHYEEDPETSERYRVHAEDPSLTWQDAGAYLLGKKVRSLANASVRGLVRDLRDVFPDEDAPAIDNVLRQLGTQIPSLEQRENVLRLIQVFVKGFGAETRS